MHDYREHLSVADARESAARLALRCRPLENLFLDAVVSVIIIGSYRSVAIHTVEGLFLAGILILLALSGW